MGGVFSQQPQQPQPNAQQITQQPVPTQNNTKPIPRAYLSYFLPMTTPDLTHTHSHPAGPGTINIVARLLTFRGLPIELAQRIVDEARYWTKCTRTNKKPCTVVAGAEPPRQSRGSQMERWTSGQEHEVLEEMQMEESGLKDRKGAVWYLCSSPIGCDPCGQDAEDVENEKKRDADVEKNPVSWIREIVVETFSRDQGWSDNAKNYGTYEHSYSWFELSLVRQRKEVPESRTKIQHNVHAGQYFKSHHNLLGSNHKLVAMAQEGDRVVLWGRAEFPGWTNNIKEATISVYTAPFPRE